MYNIAPQIGYGHSSSISPQVIVSGVNIGNEGGPHIPNVRLSFITATDQSKFEQLFLENTAGRKYLTGDVASRILTHSKLSTDALAKIWTLSNITSSGNLTFPEFALAMYLTNLKIKGQELPNSVPENIHNEQIQRSNSPSQQQIMQQQYSGMNMVSSVPNVGQYPSSSSITTSMGNIIMHDMTPFTRRMMPQQNPPQQYSTIELQGNVKIPWAVTPEEKAQYLEIFRQWDSSGLGYLTGKNLSDPNNNGKLNQDEFAVAMHLIYRKLNGYDVPTTLPPELIPPSTRELTESVNQLKSLLSSDVRASQTGLTPSGPQYLKSRSFTGTPTIERNDAVAYKHKDDDATYVSAARRRVPSISRSTSSSFSSLHTSTGSETLGDDSSNKLSELRKQIHEKQILLDALSYSAESAPISHDYSYSSDMTDTFDLKYKIKDLQKQIENAKDSQPEWVSREYNRNFDELNSMLNQHHNLDNDLNNMLSSIVPNLIVKVREINNKIVDAKLELFRIRDTQGGGSNIIGTGPGGTITEADKIKAKARAMVQERVARMTGKSITSRRFDEEKSKAYSEKATREQRIEEIERTVSKLQNSMIELTRQREEIEEKLRQFNKGSLASDIKKWEDGIGVSDEVRKFIEELKSIGNITSSRSDYLSSSKDTYNDNYQDTYKDTYKDNNQNTYKRSTSSTSIYISSNVSAPSSLSKAKTREEREAFIKAEGARRIQERFANLGIKQTNTPPTAPGSPTLTDRLAREKAEAAEREARADREHEERERLRSQKLLAEKQKKAELEAEKLRKMEEFERNEESRKNQWLSEAKELEHAKDKKARDKEEAARAMELELERRHLEEVEREKRQKEERLARIKREQEERAAEEERRRLEQEALIENSRAARERIKKREEEAKQREEKVETLPKVTRENSLESYSKVTRENSLESYSKVTRKNSLESDSKVTDLPEENVNNNPFLMFNKKNENEQSNVDDQTNSEEQNTKPITSTNPSPIQLTTLSNSSPSHVSTDRNALLSQIQQGKRLKPTKTIDKSAPLISGKTSSTTSQSNNNSHASSSNDSPSKFGLPGLPGLGGLLAAAIPNLKSRDSNNNNDRSVVTEERTISETSQQKSKSDRRVSTDWFGSLASDQLAGEGTTASLAISNINQNEAINQQQQSVETSSPITLSTVDDDIDFNQEFRVKSIYPYSGNNGPDDLQFDMGIVFIAHPSKNESNQDWWYGKIEQTKSKGWFPKTYVELYKEEKEICKARVLFKWEAQNSEQLNIEEGNVISILDKALGDWWKAEYEGAKGIIPANYVEEITSSSADEGESSEEDNEDDEEDEENGDDYDEDEDDKVEKKDDDQEYSYDIAFSEPIEIPRFNIQSEQSPKRLDFRKSTISTISSTNSLTSTLLTADGGPSASTSTWTSIINSALIENLSKEERKRQESIYELIYTEHTYCRDLEMIIDVFQRPMQEYLTKKELNLVFSNIYDLLLCNLVILSELEQRQKQDEFLLDNVGDILIKHVNELRLYKTYCGNQLNAINFLQKKINEDKKFYDFLKKCQQDSRCGSLDLSSFLLKPLQRITRYPLLIRQILHYTSKDNEDHKNLMEALHKAEEILEETNEAAREQENEIKLAEISNMTRLVGKRQFILEGSLKKVKSGRNLYGYLFNDILILCQQVKKSTSKGEDCFQVIHIQDIIKLRAPSVSVKRQWVNQLDTASGYCSAPASVDSISGTLRVLVYEGKVPIKEFEHVITLEDTLKVSLFNYDKYSRDEYLGQAEIGLHLLNYYGDNETEQIRLPLKDVPPGKTPGHICLYLSYKATQ
ncbi:2566_t:CDS:10 [Diversispora eburnea]|uniref:Actin cytoskeleton-regulatory complex protein PAN1 n=1 Tax=Diversispora eburnea TaxID=1213867 RepID=A0A9N8YK94_9GLOM|nr:2566_t:CDS:10 [Diversispora eburnea]